MPQALVLPDLALPRAVAASRTLSPSAKLAFLSIWSSIGASGLCTDRLMDLSDLVGLPERTMRHVLRELVDAGYLTPVKDGSRTFWHARAIPSPATIAAHRQPLPAPPATIAAVAIPIHRQPLPVVPENIEEIWPSSDPAPAMVATPHARALSLPSSSQKVIAQEGRKEGKEGAGRKPAPRRQPIGCPEDYAPSARTLALVTGKWPDVDASYELAKFIRYFTEGKGSRERRPEWDQSFIRWMERADASPAGAAAAPAGRGRTDAASRLTPTSERLMAIINRGTG